MGIKCPKCNTDNPETQKFCGECATPLPSSKEIPVTETLETPKEELTTGSTFAGRYRIIEELGKGGMGKVYKALDTDLKEKVAIKLIKPEVAADKNTIERFRNELKFARKIRHKNVCQMYDLNREEGTHYITMEYVHGEDLKRLIRKMGQMSAGQLISIAVQVCEGMAEAHRLGVVHRDLKPQNIMVDEEGNARIMDFGIARSVKGKGITGTGVMIGTPEYMSPEQVEGKESDQRSDIYSLGVILYEMVTGRVPFEGDTPFIIGVKHKSEAPQNPKEINSQIPEDLSNLILKCMEKDKEKRYQSAGELRSELKNIEKGIPTTEKVILKRKPITSREITVTFGLKKLFIPALVVVALVITAVVIWQPWSQKEAIPIPSDKPSLAVLYFENNSGDESLDNWRYAIPELLITDLQQSKYLTVLGGDRIYNIIKKTNLLDAEKYSTDDIRKVAAEGRVSHVLRGSFVKAGDKFIINISLLKADTGNAIRSFREEGIGESSITDSIDRITKTVKVEFNLSLEQLANDYDEKIERITTSSPEAYKFYVESRKYFHLGDYDQSIALMEKAIALDPEFAMAYRSLGAAYSNKGNYAKRMENLQKALKLSDRVSVKERLKIQGYAEVSLAKRIDALSRLIESYPDDMYGYIMLPNLYMAIGEWDKAIELSKVPVQWQVESLIPYYNLAERFMTIGLYDEAIEICENFISRFSDHEWFRHQIASAYIAQGKYELGLEEASKAFSLNPTSPIHISLKGDIFLLKGDFVRAEAEYRKLEEKGNQGLTMAGRRRMKNLFLTQGRYEEAIGQLELGIEKARKLGDMQWEMRFYNDLAYLFSKSGNHEEALDESDKWWNLALKLKKVYAFGARDKIYNLHRKGLVYLEMESGENAQKTADELKDLIQSWMGKREIRYYYHLAGLLELKRRDFSKALEYFEKIFALEPHGLQKNAEFVNSWASAYYKSGNLDKAQEAYEGITNLTTGRIGYGDIYAKSFYMLGKIYEEQGNSTKAIEHYEKFLSLWKDADPGIAEVEDAKKRLAGLKSQ